MLTLTINAIIAELAAEDTSWQIGEYKRVPITIDVSEWRKAHPMDKQRSAQVRGFARLRSGGHQLWVYPIADSNSNIRQLFISAGAPPSPCLNIAYAPDCEKALKAHRFIEKLISSHEQAQILLLGKE